MKAYQTLMRDQSAEYIVQKSRFIGRAAPARSAEEALALLDAVRQEHRAANHHCYAYIIGQNAGVMRYSDDGEPGGTAGMPIIEVMKARGVVDCVVVVTRYFGGVLLGTGGLVRAYSHTCALALNAAGICEMLPTQRWMLEVEYSLWDRLQHALKGLPVRVLQPEFTTAVNFGLLCRSADADAVMAEMTRVTEGRLESLMEEESYVAWEKPAAEEEDPDGHV